MLEIIFKYLDPRNFSFPVQPNDCYIFSRQLHSVIVGGSRLFLYLQHKADWTFENEKHWNISSCFAFTKHSQCVLLLRPRNCPELCIFSSCNEVTPGSTLWSVHYAGNPVPLFFIKHLLCSHLTVHSDGTILA